tara:strand:- start:4391 stop:4777 length:387 start_codon:yes stop_codon:yes gene_type:complete
MKISVPISVGELFDKISILEIKTNKIKDKNNLKVIKFELSELKKIIKKKKLNKSYNKIQYLKLLKINNRLWSIEDNKRKCEITKKFDKKFIELARKVYLLNDKRAEIKNKINLNSGSRIREIKSYKKY